MPGQAVYVQRRHHKFQTSQGTVSPAARRGSLSYRGPHRSPAKRVRWGEADSPYQGEMSRRDRGDREEQGSDMTDAHTWASGIKRTLRRRARRLKMPIPQESVPRKTGVWGPTPPVRGRWPEGPEGVGKPSWRTGRLCRRSDCGSPQGIFGSFLGKQKGTRPAGRNLPSLCEQKAIPSPILKNWLSETASFLLNPNRIQIS